MLGFFFIMKLMNVWVSYWSITCFDFECSL